MFERDPLFKATILRPILPILEGEETTKTRAMAPLDMGKENVLPTLPNPSKTGNERTEGETVEKPILRNTQIPTAKSHLPALCEGESLSKLAQIPKYITLTRKITRILRRKALLRKMPGTFKTVRGPKPPPLRLSHRPKESSESHLVLKK